MDELNLDIRIVKLMKDDWGMKDFFPPQKEALSHSLSGKSIMLSAPTASGKSLVAYVTIIQRLITDLKGHKAVYIVPLKALADEKYEELREIANCVGLEVGIAIGDRGGETKNIEDSDILVCTSEKLDSILRSRPNLLDKVGIVVSDEFHVLDNRDRGPTLEIVLSRLRHNNPKTQIIALSATVGNSSEIAEWLSAELISSEWRPIPLKYGTISNFEDRLEYNVHRIDGPEDISLPEPYSIENIRKNPLKSIFKEVFQSGGQLLIFVSTRASAKKEARELSEFMKKTLLAEGGGDLVTCKEKWEDISTLVSRNEPKSDSTKSLSKFVESGVGFHHAGLSPKNKKILEDSFRKGELPCIVATPTLAQGINLPSKTVVIRDLKRWGSGYLPVREVLQMMGRAGRPQYGEVGESWIMTNQIDPYDKESHKWIASKYLHGESENIESKLSIRGSVNVESDRSLLSHVLSMISTGGTDDRDAIDVFFSKTLLSSQIGREGLVERIDCAISWLANNGMIERVGESEQVVKRIRERGSDEVTEDWEDDIPKWVEAAAKVIGMELSEERGRWKYPEKIRKGPAIFGFQRASEPLSFIPDPPEKITMQYEATSLGRRISQLFIDPVSGREIRDGLDRAMKILTGEDGFGQVTPLSLLHLISSTASMRNLRVKKSEEEYFQKLITEHEREFLIQGIEDEEGSMKTSKILLEWIEETQEEIIEEGWGVLPGDLRSIQSSAERLLYSMKRILEDDRELLSMSKESHYVLINAVDEVHRRLRYGCKADLLRLVTLRDIGRKRARQMVNLLGVENETDIHSLTGKDVQKLCQLHGWSTNFIEKMIMDAGKIVRRTNRKSQ